MKYSTLIFAILSLFIACSEEQSKINSEQLPLHELPIIQNDSLTKKFSVENKKPQTALLSIVPFLDSCGFFSDTNRIKKTIFYHRWINNSKVILIQEIPFYISKPETSPFVSNIDDRIHLLRYNQYAHADTNSIKQDFADSRKDFLKAKNITGYYFTYNYKGLGGGAVDDGYIEDWEFENEIQAKKAVNTLEKIGFELYCNCFHIISYCNNHMYTLVSRTYVGKELAKKYDITFKKLKAPNCIGNENITLCR